ncbi:MAG: transposase [Clostridiaceae bacterium]|jgi:transposase|nr:transposase [Clostridiaceae bacterium]
MNEKFSKEIRQEALKLAEEIGTAAAAQRLGMKSSTLYTWKQKATKGVKDYGTGVPEKSYEELKAENERLKKENHRLKEDTEILQDALSFFAKSRKK